MPRFSIRRTNSVNLPRLTNWNKGTMNRNGRHIKPWYQSRSRIVFVVLWAIFTVCLGIMVVVIFVQPQWLGGKDPATGVITDFGLYRNCTQNWRTCTGKMSDFAYIPSGAWKASTVFVVLAFCSIFLSLLVMLFFGLCCHDKSGYGFRFSSGLQAFTGLCLFITCIVYPVGWSAPAVKAICGSSASSFNAGSCEVKWAYWIAILSMFDSFILSFLSLLFIEKDAMMLTELVTSSRQSFGFQMNGNDCNARRNTENLEITEQNTQL